MYVIVVRDNADDIFILGYVHTEGEAKDFCKNRERCEYVKLEHLRDKLNGENYGK
jgi:hypothetical protein